MQHEGAKGGILITTSGYGPSSYEFANGKPLQLIDGSGLLAICRGSQHPGPHCSDSQEVTAIDDRVSLRGCALDLMLQPVGLLVRVAHGRRRRGTLVDGRRGLGSNRLEARVVAEVEEDAPVE